MSSSVYADNNGKDILILGEGPTQGLDYATLTAEAKYPITFTQSGKRFVYTIKRKVYTIMEGIVSCLLMLQNYISSKQKSQ